MKEVDIEVHSIDDWEALYVNGGCVGQDHSHTLEEWLLGAEKPLLIKSLVHQYHEDDHVMDYAEYTGRLPEELSWIKSPKFLYIRNKAGKSLLTGFAGDRSTWWFDNGVGNVEHQGPDLYRRIEMCRDEVEETLDMIKAEFRRNGISKEDIEANLVIEVI